MRRTIEKKTNQSFVERNCEKEFFLIFTYVYLYIYKTKKLVVRETRANYFVFSYSKKNLNSKYKQTLRKQKKLVAKTKGLYTLHIKILILKFRLMQLKVGKVSK